MLQKVDYVARFWLLNINFFKLIGWYFEHSVWHTTRNKFPANLQFVVLLDHNYSIFNFQNICKCFKVCRRSLKLWPTRNTAQMSDAGYRASSTTSTGRLPHHHPAKRLLLNGFQSRITSRMYMNTKTGASRVVLMRLPMMLPMMLKLRTRRRSGLNHVCLYFCSLYLKSIVTVWFLML